MRRGLLAAAAVVLALTFASGQARADDPVDPAARAAAAAAYLDAVCPANAAGDAANAAVDRAQRAGMKPGDPTPKYLRAALRASGTALARTGRLLYEYPWPEELGITYQVKKLAQNAYENSAKASARAKARRWSTPYWSTGTDSYRAAVRLALGLDPYGIGNNGCP